MGKKGKRIWGWVLGFFVLTAFSLDVSAEEGYTYNYDVWGEVQYSPDAYRVAEVVTAKTLGLEEGFSYPEGLYVSGNRVFLCDTGNNRILELERTGVGSLELKREIKSFQGGSGGNTFSGPTDVAVSEDGFLYISDKNNNRILKLDEKLNYVMEFTKPDDVTFDQSMSFLPSKIAVDSAGRVYCTATNVNKGLIKYEADGQFSGFVGASEVTYDWVDYLWKQIATKEQRAQMESFVPTEYVNLYMDGKGFIYVCTTNVSENDLKSGKAKPVRRLNMMGSDILVRNGTDYVIGDQLFDEGGGYSGPSLFVDVAAMENNTYVCLDRNRGRLFVYDSQGRMLFAFGGNGNADGYFRLPAAIEHMGHDLLVLDSQDCSITLFTPTQYGSLVYQAIEEFQAGSYTASGDTWREVLALNGNYDQAYIGIGTSLLRQEKYHEAMDYFRLKWDADNYSNAFKQYRKEWVEEHIILIVGFLFLVLCVPLAIGRIKAIKHEIDIADIFRGH